MPRVFILKKCIRPHNMYKICIENGSATRYYFFVNSGADLESALKEYLATESYFSKGDIFEFGNLIMVKIKE